MPLDVTTPARELARAAARLVKLLPQRLVDPVLGGVVLDAATDSLTVAGTDRERSITLSTTAHVHGAGRALVPLRPLAETLRHLDDPDVRLVVEGSRLAVRTPRARFAVPLLELDRHPGVRPCPPAAGTLSAGFAAPAGTVAAAASRDDALPVFTGVHVRGRDEHLVLVGTDRFRMAVATVPWSPSTDELDVLVPSSLLAEVAKQAPDGAEVTLHADRDRVGFSWPGTEISTTVLDAGFPAESRHLDPAFDGTVEVDAEALAGAVRRVSPYAGDAGSVRFEVDEAELRVRADDPQVGDADEAVKATVSGDRVTLAFQPRYLADALQAFGARTVRIGLRSGARHSSVISAAHPDGDLSRQGDSPRRSTSTLHYVLMPKRLPGDTPT